MKKVDSVELVDKQGKRREVECPECTRLVVRYLRNHEENIQEIPAMCPICQVRFLIKK